LAAPKESSTDYFYKKFDADELLLASYKGTGTLKNPIRRNSLNMADTYWIPRGMIYQIKFDTEDNDC
jgi:homogentisate 1,2-dioxygenase